MLMENDKKNQLGIAQRKLEQSKGQIHILHFSPAKIYASISKSDEG